MQLLRMRKEQLETERVIAGEGWDNSSNLVFTIAPGGHLIHVSVYKDFKDIATSLSLEVSRFHDLRHSSAVAAIESGDDIKPVQTNLGHAAASFTLDVYGHASQRMRQQSADRTERYIQDVLNRRDAV